jgi:uncharacterized protein (DUF58 family)
MIPRYRVRSRVLRYAWGRWRDQITPAGKCLVGAVALAALGTVSVQIPVYQIFCALTVVLAFAEITGVILIPNVRISGAMPEKTTAGETVVGQFQVTNRSRRPIYDLSLRFLGLPAELKQPEIPLSVGHLKYQETATVPVSLQTLKRGIYDLPRLKAYSTFPFNLVRAGLSHWTVPPLLVLPKFHPVAGIDLPVSSKYQPGGIALTSNVGESPEYIGNREYVPGESARRLDFRSWARLGKPVVREYQEEYYCRVGLVLDTFVERKTKAGPDGFPNLEAAISLTASAADALSRGEYLIDLFAVGDELHVFRAGRHTAHFENVLEILACVEACRTNPFQKVSEALIAELGNISSIVCVFLDWDRSRQQLVQTALEAGCGVKVFIVCRDESFDTTEVPDVDVSRFTLSDINNGGVEEL